MDSLNPCREKVVSYGLRVVRVYGCAIVSSKCDKMECLLTLIRSFCAAYVVTCTKYSGVYMLVSDPDGLSLVFLFRAPSICGMTPAWMYESVDACYCSYVEVECLYFYFMDEREYNLGTPAYWLYHCGFPLSLSVLVVLLNCGSYTLLYDVGQVEWQ